MDRVDNTFTWLWAVLGLGLILKPAGWVGGTDLVLGGGTVWLISLLGLCYLTARGRDS